ncbi:hypothetical protein [Micrococcus sp. IITD107]|uniref:hypothetical protein n=1 Tax=Micrococcus sp. IITD107 TaxID=3342790 RepID=UPI0035B84AE0
MPFARRRRLALALIALSALVLIGLPLGLIGWYVGTARVVNAGPVIQAEVVRQTAIEDLSIDYHVEVHGRLAAVDTSWLEGFQACPGSRIPVVLHPHDPGTVIAVGSHRPWQREPLVEVAAVGAGLLLAGSAAGVLTYHLVPETWERLSARLRRGLVRMTPPDGIRRLVAAAIPVLAVGICVLILWCARADHLRRAELVENSVPLRAQVLQTNDSRFKGQTYTEYLVDTPALPPLLGRPWTGCERQRVRGAGRPRARRCSLRRPRPLGDGSRGAARGAGTSAGRPDGSRRLAGLEDPPSARLGEDRKDRSAVG